MPLEEPMPTVTAPPTESELRATMELVVRELRLRTPELVVERSPMGWIHILISTPSFEGMTRQQRRNLLWREFERRFDDDTLLDMTRCHLMTPAEREDWFGPRSMSDDAISEAGPVPAMQV